MPMPRKADLEDSRTRASEALLDALREGKPGSAAAKLLSDLVPIFREIMALDIDVPASAMLTVGRFRSHVLNACGLDPKAQVNAGIRRELEAAANEVYAERRKTAVRSREGGDHAVEDISLELAEVSEKLSLTDLQLLSAIKGSRSGAYVGRVYFRNAEGECFGILKLLDNEDDYTRELNGHAQANESWLASLCVPPPQHTELSRSHSRRFALLSEVTLPGDYGQPSQTLRYLLTRRDTKQLLANVQEIGRAYGSHVSKIDQAPRRSQPQRNFVQKLLERWGKTYPDDVWNTDSYWHMADLPGPNEREYRDGTQIYINPLWLMSNGLGAEATFLESFQHGDLNSENVLAGAGGFCFIDLEKAGVTSACLDPVWLCLWLLRESRGSLQPSEVALESLPQAFVNSCIGSKEPRIHLGELDLGIELASGLMSEFLDQAMHSTEFLGQALPLQVRLTIAAAALGMAFYEVRGIERCLIVGAGVDVPRFWAVEFFRIAMVALSPLE